MPDAGRDFAVAMLALDQEGIGQFAFGAVCCGVVSDDEARLLALFDASLEGADERVDRLAGVLVKAEAVTRFITAVEQVSAHLRDGIYAE